MPQRHAFVVLWLMKKRKGPHRSNDDQLIREAMRVLTTRRMSRMTPEQKKKLATKAVTARWAKMTAEERSEQAKERWRRIKQKSTKAGKRARQRKKPSPD